MNSPLKTTVPAQPPSLEDWFVALGPDFLGRVSTESLRPGMAIGWRVGWRGRELQVQVDQDFPFSAARVYLVGYEREVAQPHVEPDGKLCLRAKPFPNDALRTVRSALADAFRLLRENETRQHDDDFQEDFGLYWLHWADNAPVRANLLPGRATSHETRVAVTLRSGNEAFIFPGRADAERFCANLAAARPRRLRSAAIIAIDPLPAPCRYPASASDLWGMVEARSSGGIDVLANLVVNHPKEAFVVLAGCAASGREHYAALRIRRPLDASGKPQKRRMMRAGIPSGRVAAKDLFSRYVVERVITRRIDASSTRLPREARSLEKGRVVVVGCGALGSGVARLLAQSAVEHITLVDPETLSWENIRRHELGARSVGHGKAESLAAALRRDLPLIKNVQGHRMTFATFATRHPETLKHADLVISCTGNWAADASVEHALRAGGHKASAVYGWMEAHALAAHAVLIGSDGASLSDGFDEYGEFRLPAVSGGKPPPPECGGASTPFGAIELSNAQSLVARLAIDALRENTPPRTWRTWLANATALRDAEAEWAPDWVAKRGEPAVMGAVLESEWDFQ